MKLFKVIQSNPTDNGKFITKLQAETIIKDELFGDKTKKETYYISGNKQVQVGLEVPESALFPKYYAKEYDGINPETNEPIKMKWLHAS